jgi:hypothetical protein
MMEYIGFTEKTTLSDDISPIENLRTLRVMLTSRSAGIPDPD